MFCSSFGFVVGGVWVGWFEVFFISFQITPKKNELEVQQDVFDTISTEGRQMPPLVATPAWDEQQKAALTLLFKTPQSLRLNSPILRLLQSQWSHCPHTR